MKIFSELEVPNLICRFDRYVQSIEVLQMLIYMLAIYGLFNIFLLIYERFRIGGNS